MHCNMKKIMILAALAATVTLTACGGKSDASREQISKGREQAKEMIKATKAQQAKPEAKPAAKPEAKPEAKPDTTSVNPG